MAVTDLVTALIQAGLGLAAWRLANALRGRVEDHEVRIVKLEAR